MITYGNHFVGKRNNYFLTAIHYLPLNTIRVRTNDGNPPIKTEHTTYETATLVDGTTDIYDVYKTGTNFYGLLEQSTNVIEVIEANTTGITNMSQMFSFCTALERVPLFDTSNVSSMVDMFENTKITSVPLFDTHNVTTMYDMFNLCKSLETVPLFDTSNVTIVAGMFANCQSLKTVPLFDTHNVTQMYDMFGNCHELTYIPLFNTSKVINMDFAFQQCFKVESGALALYQQASSQANPPTSHQYTFMACGKDTTAGAAELAQIPSSWK